MTRWLFGLLWGCNHLWETIDKLALFEDGDAQKIPVGRKYHLRCTKCGKIKGVKV